MHQLAIHKDWATKLWRIWRLTINPPKFYPPTIFVLAILQCKAANPPKFSTAKVLCDGICTYTLLEHEIGSIQLAIATCRLVICTYAGPCLEFLNYLLATFNVTAELLCCLQPKSRLMHATDEQFSNVPPPSEMAEDNAENPVVVVIRASYIPLSKL